MAIILLFPAFYCISHPFPVRVQGNHNELVTLDGKYNEMLKLQGDASGGNDNKAAQAAGPSAVQTTTIAEDDSRSDKDSSVQDETLDMSGIDAWAWKQARPDLFYIVMSCFGGVLVGVLWPANAIILSKAIGVILEVRYHINIGTVVEER